MLVANENKIECLNEIENELGIDAEHRAWNDDCVSIDLPNGHELTEAQAETWKYIQKAYER